MIEAKTLGRVEQELNGYQWVDVPRHLVPALRRWIGYGEEPGYFLQAVLRNDLREAVLLADADSRAGLLSIIIFLATWPPSPCWGSTMAYTRWGRLNGLRGGERVSILGLPTN